MKLRRKRTILEQMAPIATGMTFLYMVERSGLLDEIKRSLAHGLVPSEAVKTKQLPVVGKCPACGEMVKIGEKHGHQPDPK